MNQYSSIYYSPIYRSFKSIDETSYRAIVYFFEQNEQKIQALDFEEYFDLLVNYTSALLRSEEYQKHLLMTDVVIETSFDQNIIFWKEEDLLEKMLFEKAFSFFKITEYKKCKHALQELLRLNPFHDEARQLFAKCLWHDFPSFIQPMRAFAIASFLITALIIAIHLVIVLPLFQDYVPGTEMLRNTVFAVGLGSLIFGYGFHAYRVRQETQTTFQNSEEHFLEKNLKDF